MARKIADRTRYRQRIANLVKKPPTSADEGIGPELEVRSHWAKYTCVLISGFIEQAIKEIILEYASPQASPRVRKYVEGTWPKSKNTEWDEIKKILGYFDDNWKTGFEEWLAEYAPEIVGQRSRGFRQLHREEAVMLRRFAFLRPAFRKASSWSMRPTTSRGFSTGVNKHPKMTPFKRPKVFPCEE